jgi:hypothetical protein
MLVRLLYKLYRRQFADYLTYSDFASLFIIFKKLNRNNKELLVN